MTPEQWREIDQVLSSALDLWGSERSAYVDLICNGRPELRAELESLLAAHGEAGDFIEAAIASGTRLEAPQETSLVGRRIGSYKLVKEIGRGGMGTVYRAERDDQQFSKDVAIKLVGAEVSSASSQRRFHEEQQILATLEHPNIARLLDGGVTADGLHYIVMEYVEGVRIDEYCEGQGLNLEDRLKIFQSVCSAVHFAHQHLVVHRDIKPSNILVTAAGVPKLLDFGIAKILDPAVDSPQAMATHTIARAMTPDYASPEQLSGGTITTASDIYSLGVLLYELLVGTPPYRLTGKTLGEILTIVWEQDPPRPSTAVTTSTPESVRDAKELRRRLAGDLDNIVLTAITKDPQRRYGSVEQFSDDIRRHLEGFPVIARKDSGVYRARKFIRRHTTSLIAAALILVTLIAGVIATVWQARIAHIQRARAEQRFNDVRKLANSFMFDLETEIQGLPGSTHAQEMLVKTALQYLDSLARESNDAPSLQRELAIAYQRVGDIEGRRGSQSLGNTAGALESYGKALRIRETLVAASPADAKTLGELATILARIAGILELRNDPAGALEYDYKALEIREAIYRANPADRDALSNLALIRTLTGRHLHMKGDWSGALQNDLKSASILEKIAAASMDERSHSDLEQSYAQLARDLNKSGDRVKALEYCAKAQAIGESLLANHPNNVSLRLNLSADYQHTGTLLAEAQDFDKSLESWRKALALGLAVAEADPKDSRAKIVLATCFNRVGWLLVKTGRARNVDDLLKGLEIRQKLYAFDPTNPRRRDTLANSYATIGEAEAMLASNPRLTPQIRFSHWKEARSRYGQAVAIWVELRTKGLLRAEDAGEPDRIAGEIAKCDVALNSVGHSR